MSILLKASTNIHLGTLSFNLFLFKESGMQSRTYSDLNELYLLWDTLKKLKTWKSQLVDQSQMSLFVTY